MLTDEDFDHMWHAIGRPMNPLQETHRNYFCCGVDSPTHDRFLALSEYWWACGTLNDGAARSRIFTVTPEGRRALVPWVKQKRPAWSADVEELLPILRPLLLEAWENRAAGVYEAVYVVDDGSGFEPAGLDVEHMESLLQWAQERIPGLDDPSTCSDDNMIRLYRNSCRDAPEGDE